MAWGELNLHVLRLLGLSWTQSQALDVKGAGFLAPRVAAAVMVLL